MKNVCHGFAIQGTLLVISLLSRTAELHRACTGAYCCASRVYLQYKQGCCQLAVQTAVYAFRHVAVAGAGLS